MSPGAQIDVGFDGAGRKKQALSVAGQRLREFMRP